MNQDEIKAKIFRRYNGNSEDALRRFGLTDPSANTYICVVGRDSRIRHQIFRIYNHITRAEYLEKILSKGIVKQSTRDEINYLLTFSLYPQGADELTEFLSVEQNGWLSYQREKVSELYKLKSVLEEKSKKTRSAIKSDEIKQRLFSNEAENYEVRNLEKLSKSEEMTISSPSNRSVCRSAGDLFILAKNYEKAEKYFLRAGSYEWVHAARTFEKLRDRQRAVRFWKLAAQYPTGYFDERDENSGDYWLKAGNIEEAIKAYKSAADYYEVTDGSYDLHGSPKKGKFEALSVRAKVKFLMEKLAKRKPPKK